MYLTQPEHAKSILQNKCRQTLSTWLRVLTWSGTDDKKSTENASHALISMTESIKNTTDNGSYGCGVFIDLKKAFDTVNHSILLKKMEHYCVRGIALNWFTSYLSNRKQYVSVNGHTSEYLNISCGFRQGSVLEPIFDIHK